MKIVGLLFVVMIFLGWGAVVYEHRQMIKRKEWDEREQQLTLEAKSAGWQLWMTMYPIFFIFAFNLEGWTITLIMTMILYLFAVVVFFSRRQILRQEK